MPEPSPLGIVDGSRSVGRTAVCDEDSRALGRVGIQFSGLSLEAVGREEGLYGHADEESESESDRLG